MFKMSLMRFVWSELEKNTIQREHIHTHPYEEKNEPREKYVRSVNSSWNQLKKGYIVWNALRHSKTDDAYSLRRECKREHEREGKA